MPQISAYRRRSRSASAAPGPWYVKGFVGAANPDVGGIDYELITPDFVTLRQGHQEHAAIRRRLRLRHRPLFPLRPHRRISRRRAVRRSTTNIPAGRILRLHGAGLIGTNEYTADIESWLGLVNAYIDLGTWWCITPYVGGGVGFASLSVIGLQGRQRAEWRRRLWPGQQPRRNFAWAVYAGLSYKVNPSLTLDLSYRYTDLGDIRTGNITTYDLTANLGRLRDRGHHLQRSHAFACAWLWAASQRRCRSPLNRSPSTIDC